MEEFILGDVEVKDLGGGGGENTWMGEGYFQRNLRVRQLEAGYNGCFFFGGGEVLISYL